MRVTFYSPVPLGHARHALPHSHGRQLERGPGPGAPNARRGTWGLRTPSARLRSSCSWPPPRPPSSLLVPSRERPAFASRAACGITSPGPELLGAGRQQRARRAARPRGRRGAALSSSPRASLFPAARRRRGRREGPRPGAPGLGGGSGPLSEAAPRPTPELRAPPLLAPAPSPSAIASILPAPGLGSPSGQAPGPGKLRCPLPMPPARLPRRRPAQAGCKAGRSPAARRALILAESDWKRGRRSCLKRRAFPAAASSQPGSAEGYLHSSAGRRARHSAGTQVPVGGRDAGM